MSVLNPWTLDHCESPDIWSHSPWRWHNSRTRGTTDLRSRTASSVSESRNGDVMSNKKIWFITGAGRGMGVDFAKAALAAGHAVVASGRDRDAVSKAVGAGHAQAALGAHHLDLLDSGPRRLRVRYRLRRVEVRPRGMDGVAGPRGRTVRHHHHHRQPGVLPYGAPHGAIDE